MMFLSTLANCQYASIIAGMDASPEATEREMNEQERCAHEAIRRTINTYNIAGDSRNAALYTPLWAEEAVLEFTGFPPVPGFRCDGGEEIANRTAAWTSVAGKDPSFSKTKFIRHNLTTSLITLTGTDTAKARTYFIVMTEIGQDHCGTYDDELIYREGQWLFAHRKIALDWRSADSLFPPL